MSFGLWFGIVWYWRSISCFRLLASLPYMSIWVGIASEPGADADIYGVIRKFMESMYREGKLRDFSFLKLTGQSCKIDIFKEAMKEFIPGKMIQFKRSRRGRAEKEDIGLKMNCVDGALKFMRDKRLGYAQIEYRSDKPVLPYTVSAFTHSGEEVELVNGFWREEETRYVSRNLADVTLYLYLKDTEGWVRNFFDGMR